MIAVFCLYQRDFEELAPTPRKMFKCVKNINDIRGIKFTGIIRNYNWYRGGKEMMEAYYDLQIRQPELFS